VFAGIGISLLVDKRFRFSSGRASLEQELSDGRHHLDQLEVRRDAARERWTSEIGPRAGQDEELEFAARELRESRKRLGELRERRSELEAAIGAEDDAFRDYRAAFRQSARAAAAGERRDELTARGGKVYKEVTLTRVTSEGVEFSHSEGVSRLRPEELDPSWQERFQWHPEERIQAASGTKPAEGGQDATPTPPAPALSSAEDLAEQAAAKKLAGLRRDFAEALRHLGKAEAELARARADAGANRGRSVPGSLETWEERVRYLEANSAKFRERYLAARGRLAAASPDDGLLRDAPP
jgi:hypothetical protein